MVISIRGSYKGIIESRLSRVVECVFFFNRYNKRIQMENPLIANIVLFIFLIVIPLLFFDVFLLAFVYHSNKKIAGTIVVIGLIVFELIIIKKYFFPTYWKYPDRLIHSDIVRYVDVEEVFGDFDKEGSQPDYKAYYIYTDKEGN